jgi:hypothetical protein
MSFDEERFAALVKEIESQSVEPEPEYSLEPPDHLGELRSRIKTGGRFVLDEPAGLDAIWGHGDQVAWAAGEPLVLNGPTGVGKTTVAMQLVAGRLGIIDGFLAARPARAPGRWSNVRYAAPCTAKRARRPGGSFAASGSEASVSVPPVIGDTGLASFASGVARALV